MSVEKIEKLKPAKEVIKETKYQIFNMEDLPDDERLAMQDAIAAYKQSTNTEFLAGACAVAYNGEKIVKHNHSNEPGKGQEGHAEMLALDGLYATVNPADRKLKMLALAASYPDEELLREGKKYDENTRVENLHDIDVHPLCGRCLKMISDYTGNNTPYSAETGKRPAPWDPVILMYTGTGQVVRSTLSVLYPMPHVPHQIKIRPWEKKDRDQAPDTYSAK